MKKKAWIYCRRNALHMSEDVERTKRFLEERCEQLGYEVLGFTYAQGSTGETKQVFKSLLRGISAEGETIDIVVQSPNAIARSTADAIELCDAAEAAGIKIYDISGSKPIDIYELLEPARICEVMYTPIGEMTMGMR